MRSVDLQDPSLPAVICQRTDANDALCSLMSALFLREERPPHSDRKHDRKATIISTEYLPCIHITMHVPEGFVGSHPVLLVLRPESPDDQILSKAIVGEANNRGHRVIEVTMGRNCHIQHLWEMLRKTQEKYRTAKMFLFCPLSCWYEDILGILCLSGVVLFGEFGSHWDSGRRLLYHEKSMLIITSNRCHMLHQMVRLNPHVILVELPDNDNVILNALSKIRWLSRCFLDFVEAHILFQMRRDISASTPASSISRL